MNIVVRIINNMDNTINDLYSKIENKSIVVSIIGMGYVGLPLAVEFGKIFETFGFDINSERIDSLKNGIDETLECSSDKLASAKKLIFTTSSKDLKRSDIYIITVPTPVDANNNPDLRPLFKASESVGQLLSSGNIVIYESTVYPGCTEEDCAPILEKESGLKYLNNDDESNGFYIGYSPERINPGDKDHTITKILKVTSGSTPKISKLIDAFYCSIIKVGTHLAPSIKVAEAAKVIENTQRDINIAFINELSIIFDRMDINTKDVLDAAGTKWNFLSFWPGLVGGHCIGVDPYYLTKQAERFGYHPEMILAGRRINDNMGKEVALRVIKLMLSKNQLINKAKVLIMGITFKENCPDIRNSRVIDIIHELNTFGCIIDIFDPWADVKKVQKEYGLNLLSNDPNKKYNAIIVAVGHQSFKDMDLEKIKSDNSIIFDLKNILPEGIVDGSL